MQFHFKIHQGRDGFWADCIELKGCRTQADTREELAANAKEALDLFLNESDDSGILFPGPRKRVSGQNILAVSVDPEIAFAQKFRIS